MISEHGRGWADAARPRGRIGRRIEAHLRIGSTNDRARELLGTADAEAVVVVAEEQTTGRGRHGRSWLSPPGRNLLVSIPLRPRLPAGQAGPLSLAMALAVREACAAVAPCRLKWPNDVEAEVDGRKLGGLLIETVVAGERLDGAVVGIGINANWSRADMPPAIRERATSLADLAGRPVDRVALLRDVLASVERRLGELEAGASPLDEYRAACATLGADVVVETGAGRVEGRATDVDEHGALLVATARGSVTISSGEVVAARPGVPA